MRETWEKRRTLLKRGELGRPEVSSKQPEFGGASSDVGSTIVSVLEVAESDFTQVRRFRPRRFELSSRVYFQNESVKD